MRKIISFALFIFLAATTLNLRAADALPDAEGAPTLRYWSPSAPANPPKTYEADVIIYGPGTQHSSLFPSYMTRGVGEAIADNRKADKIFVGNIVRDLDMQEDDINDLADKFMQAMTRKGEASLAWRDCVTQFFVQRNQQLAA